MPDRLLFADCIICSFIGTLICLSAFSRAACGALMSLRSLWRWESGDTSLSSQPRASVPQEASSDLFKQQLSKSIFNQTLNDGRARVCLLPTFLLFALPPTDPLRFDGYLRVYTNLRQNCDIFIARSSTVPLPSLTCTLPAILCVAFVCSPGMLLRASHFFSARSVVHAHTEEGYRRDEVHAPPMKFSGMILFS